MKKWLLALSAFCMSFTLPLECKAVNHKEPLGVLACPEQILINEAGLFLETSEWGQIKLKSITQCEDYFVATPEDPSVVSEQVLSRRCARCGRALVRINGVWFCQKCR